MPSEAPTPVRGLGMLDAALVVCGSIIGAAIFFVSGDVAASVHSRATFLAVWIAGGILALAGALASGELGSMFPRGGGEYVYLREAYGPIAGFLSGWTSFWIGFPGSIATMASGFGRSISTLVGVTGRPFEIGVALAAIVALTAINAFGLRAGKWTQNVLSGAKLVVLGALVLLALVARPDARAEASPYPASPESAAGIASALVPVTFAYLGWNAATYVAGEIRQPERNLGRALILGTAISTLIYVAINVTYVRALPLDELRASKSVASDALARLVGPVATSVLTPLVAVAILGSLQATVITGPRIYQAMGEDGVFVRALGRLHPKSRVPVVGLLTQGVLACALLLTGNFEQLLQFTTFAIMLFATLTVIAVFVLRVRQPRRERAFRAMGYPVTPALFVAGNAWVMWKVLAGGGRAALVGLGIVAVGVPVYAWFRLSRGTALPSQGDSSRLRKT